MRKDGLVFFWVEFLSFQPYQNIIREGLPKSPFIRSSQDWNTRRMRRDCLYEKWPLSGGSSDHVDFHVQFCKSRVRILISYRCLQRLSPLISCILGSLSAGQGARWTGYVTDL